MIIELVLWIERLKAMWITCVWLGIIVYSYNLTVQASTVSAFHLIIMITFVAEIMLTGSWNHNNVHWNLTDRTAFNYLLILLRVQPYNCTLIKIYFVVIRWVVRILWRIGLWLVLSVCSCLVHLLFFIDGCYNLLSFLLISILK